MVNVEELLKIEPPQEKTVKTRKHITGKGHFYQQRIPIEKTSVEIGDILLHISSHSDKIVAMSIYTGSHSFVISGNNVLFSDTERDIPKTLWGKDVKRVKGARYEDLVECDEYTALRDVIVLDGKLLSNGKVKIKEKIPYNIQVGMDEILRIVKIIRKNIFQIQLIHDVIKKSLLEFFDEDEFSIEYFPKFSVYPEFIYRINIIHKDVTVTNSVEESHYIGDVMTSYHIKAETYKDGFRIYSGNSFGLTRLTYTPKDIYSGFTHSHVSFGLTASFASFCTGDADLKTDNVIHTRIFPISSDDEIFSEAHDDIIKKATRIDSMVRWESLEGGPYKSIGTLNRPQHKLNYTHGLIRNTEETPYLINRIINETNDYPDYFRELLDCFSFLPLKSQNTNKTSLEFIFDKDKFIKTLSPLIEVMLDNDDIDQNDTRVYIPQRGIYKANYGVLSGRYIKNIRKTYTNRINDTILFVGNKYIRKKIIDVKETEENKIESYLMLVPSTTNMLIGYFKNQLISTMIKELSNEQ